MPPLKTYIFIPKENDIGILEIKILAYEEISAKWKLETIVKNPSDYKIKN